MNILGLISQLIGIKTLRLTYLNLRFLEVTTLLLLFFFFKSYIYVCMYKFENLEVASLEFIYLFFFFLKKKLKLYKK